MNSHNWLLPSSAKGFRHVVTCLSRLLKSQSMAAILYLQILLEFFEPALDGMDFLELKRGKVKCGYNGFAYSGKRKKPYMKTSEGKEIKNQFQKRHVIRRPYIPWILHVQKNTIHTLDCMLFLSVISTEG